MIRALDNQIVTKVVYLGLGHHIGTNSKRRVKHYQHSKNNLVSTLTCSLMFKEISSITKFSCYYNLTLNTFLYLNMLQFVHFSIICCCASRRYIVYFLFIWHYSDLVLEFNWHTHYICVPLSFSMYIDFNLYHWNQYKSICSFELSHQKW